MSLEKTEGIRSRKLVESQNQFLTVIRKISSHVSSVKFAIRTEVADT